jgi:hypothetical protein
MGKNKWMNRNTQQNAAPPIGPDAPTIDDGDDDDKTPTLEETDGIAAGQIWDGVVVPDRSVNVLSLTPGAVLGALMVDGPFNDGASQWCASFVGEQMTKIKVDAAMLKTGRLRTP